MVAKLLVDVKTKNQLEFCADPNGRIAKNHTSTAGKTMISPFESAPFHPDTLQFVPLLALLTYVDRDGNQLKIRGKAARVIQSSATQLSQGTLWVLENGEVAQAYQRGIKIPNDPEAIDFTDTDGSQIDKETLSEIGLIITRFEHGIFGACRGTGHGTERVLYGIEAFRSLILLSDEALEHAIGTNLESYVSIREHNKYIKELNSLVSSNGELADEIRTFLEKMGSARDRTDRHNVYRMVLIVRAIQRRAIVLKDQRGTTLQAITKTGLDISKYISAIMGLAARIITELNDEQPWWIEGQSGNLKPYIAARRRESFRSRLEQYSRELRSVTANPLADWANIADSALFQMIQGNDVVENARKVVDVMHVILAREKLSRAVMNTQLGVAVQDDKKQGCLDLLSDLYIRVGSVVDAKRAEKLVYLSNVHERTIADSDIPELLREAENRLDDLFR